MKLYPKTTIILLSTALLPIIVISVAAYYIAAVVLKQHIVDSLESTAIVQKNRIENNLQRNVERMDLITSRPPMRAALENYLRTGDKEQREIVTTVLSNAKAVVKDIQNIHILNLEGKVAVSTNDSLLSVDFSKEDFFIRGKSGYSMDVFSLNKDKVVNYLSCPLVHEERLLGILVVETRFDPIIKITNDYAELEKTGETALAKIDKNGDALFIVPLRFDKNAALKRTVSMSNINTPIVQSLMKGDKIIDDAIDYRGMEVLCVTRHIGQTNWGLAVKIDRDEAFSPLLKLRNLFVGVAAITVILILIISFYSARSITMPIMNLTTTARRIKEGDTSARADVSSCDEIGFLSETFNEMTANLLESRKKLEHDIDEQYKLFFENAVETILLIEAEGQHIGAIIKANKSASEMYGYTIEELQEMSVYDMNPADKADPVRESIDRVISGEQLKGETINIRKDGSSFPVEFTAVLLEIKNKKYIIGFSKDISERKNMEAAQITARKEAEKANKAKSEFIANISHEIRTPMNAIIGLSSLALKTDLTAKQRDYISKLLLSAKSLLGIINDVLDISKIESNKLEIEAIDFNLDDILNDIAAIHTLKAEEKGIELIYSLSDDIPKQLTGDPLRLGQVITNLLNNAIKFTEKGEIILSVRALHVTETEIILEFSISDTGIGIKPEQLTSLFRPFTQLDASTTRIYGGTGLGLTICKNLVKQMHGDITVTSEYGKGTKFTFTVLLGCQRPCGADRYAFPPDFHKLKALVVDDNETSRTILKSILESFSFSVTTVDSGESAVNEIKLVSGAPQDCQYRLTLMDYKMPGMDGIETIKRIQNNAGLINVPTIIMVTAHDSDDLRQSAKELGVDVCLSKPVHPSLLFNAILEVFGQCKPLSAKKLATELHTVEDIKGAKVLVVEDHPINRQVARELLELSGVKVEFANNGRVAVSKIVEQGNVYDVVLMDIQMPEMDGFQATTAIRKKYSQDELPIIAMTAHAMKEEIEKCFNAGMNDYISKPIEIEAFYDKLSKLLKTKLDVRETPSADEVYFPHEFKGIDVKALLRRLNYNTKLLENIMIEFRSTSESMRDKIVEAITAKEYDKAKHLLHGFKGMAANLSAIDICNEIITIENALSDETPVTLDRFGAELRRLYNSIDVWENLKKNKAVQIGGDAPLDVNFLKDIYFKLSALLNENALHTISYYESIKGTIESVSGTEMAGELQENITNLNYAEALSVLRQVFGNYNFT
ncbi:response regulator [Candidatus Magnetominusculus dajiuhuensis]|uniref:response regulator n=1 Tax=Candidatus Magnetominusculus dajiuhuensis TaxID=3137712 RepID=UPI003B435C16